MRHGLIWPLYLVVTLSLLGQTSLTAPSVAVLAEPAPTVEWMREFGTNGLDQASSVAVDGFGNVYVVGTTSGSFPGQSYPGGNVFLRKYTCDGVEQWTHQFDTQGGSPPFVAVDALGNAEVYVARVSVWGYEFGTFSKYDSLGTELWRSNVFPQVLDSTENKVFIGVDGSGCAYLVTWAARIIYFSDEVYRATISKYDEGGDFRWVKPVYVEWRNWPGGAAVDGLGNVYVGGVDHVYGPGAVPYISKHDSDGAQLWRDWVGWEWDGPQPFGFGTVSGVAVDGQGNAYLLGRWSGDFLRKYNSAGDVQWTIAASGTGVTTDGSGNIYVMGGGALVRKYDGAGKRQWTDGMTRATAQAAAADNFGNLYVVGWTDDTLPGQTSSGGRDAFVRKYSAVETSLCFKEYRWSTLPGHVAGYAWDPFPTVFKSWNQVQFMNAGSLPVSNVTATITCAPANVAVADGEVSFGDITILPGEMAWSIDDYALSTDLTLPLPPASNGIAWRIEYDDVDGVRHTVNNVSQLCGQPVNCP